jgi:MarR family transcriptional regulator, 2-MHQ and catechol-resistance regulon repressor
MPTRYRGTPEEVRALNAYIKLQRAAETAHNRTSAHLSDCGLTTSQFAVLEALYHLGPLSQRALAQKLLKSTGNISIVLKHMEGRGLISRSREAADHRTMRVDIAELGRALLEQVLARHVAGIVAEMSVLTAAEQDELGRLCRKLGLRQEPGGEGRRAGSSGRAGA